METNRDRLNLLKMKIKQMETEFDDKKQQEYIKFVEKIAEGKLEMKVISDEMWDVMLPKEQEANLLFYFHTLRTEYSQMIEKVKKLGVPDKIGNWLDSPWGKIILTSAALIETAYTIYTIIKATGLFYFEPADGDGNN
jgi:hypothetical protein